MTDKPKGLHAKLAEVMAEAERIPKNGSYKKPGEYGHFMFVQVGDAADAIRTALAARKVSMLPSAIEVMAESEHETKSGGTMTTQTVRTTWTLVDGETGETATIQSLGTGADAGDKYSPKAQTNAMKYALLMGFLLSTGDDPELTDTSDRRSRQNRSADAAVARQGVVSAPVADPATSGLVGTPKASGNDDFELRQTPDGWALPFRLTENGRGGVKVLARDTLAQQIAEYRAGIEGQLATVWGSFEDKSFDKPDGKTITYRVLNLTRLKVGVLDLTAIEEPEPVPLSDPDGDFDAGWLDKVPA